MSEGRATKTTNANKLVAIVLGLPWVEILADAWKFGRKVLRGMTNEGMYEMLKYETELEILDNKGKKAKLHKFMRVRYLQDNIIAFQDFAWGDGKTLRNYQSSPGKPVDRYKSGYKTYVLLSLHEVRNRGDVDDFHISWEIYNGFLKSAGYGFWETEITSRMKDIEVNVIFPKENPPLNVVLIESNRRRTATLGKESYKQLPDGRWKITWGKTKPILFENYILKWDWGNKN